MPLGKASARVVLIIAALLGSAGCGPSGRPELAPVKGTVTYGGEPLPQGRITFAPPGGRPAFGQIVDGNIVRVTSHVPDDGAPVGQYPVGISSYEPRPDMYSPAGPSLIPTRYVRPDTSGFTVTIKAGQTNQLHFDLERE